MAAPSKQPDTKISKGKELFKWLFDLAFLGCLIWYFSVPGHTESFWGLVSSKFEHVVGYVMSKFPVHGMENAPQVAASAPNSGLQPLNAWRLAAQARPAVPPAATSSTPPTATPALPPPTFIPPPLPTAGQLSKEVGGDCYPPEVRGPQDAQAIANLFYQPPAIPKPKKHRDVHGKPIEIARKKIKGVSLYVVTIDLQDPETYLVIRLPHDSDQANSIRYTGGHEAFETFVKRYHAAAIMNGTFFSKDEEERVMGNMVSEGTTLKYSEWENYGTTLGLREGNCPEMVTARAEGKPDWNSHWFSLTCGPRLLKNGEVWVNPTLEGFQDPHVLGIGSRCAIGFPEKRDKLYLVSFLHSLSLEHEAELMKALGCYEAMNLDGGASKALAQDKSILMKPGRALTNVLVVYDSKHKAPDSVIASWKQFNKADVDNP